MKSLSLYFILCVILAPLIGCTRIVSMEPTSGPPGTPVYIECAGMFGDPTEVCLHWDGHKLSDPFPGSFVVPPSNDGGSPGKHTVILMDNLDADEAFLIFPIFRSRLDFATFTVTEP